MDSKRKNILVVDDDEDIRSLINSTLKGTEFVVFEASNGREGIHIAKKIKPDIILMDIMMPNFDGFMTARVIKRNPRTKDIPIIFLTVKKTKEDISTALKSGGSDYIVKPFSPDDLLKRLRKVV